MCVCMAGDLGEDRDQKEGGGKEKENDNEAAGLRGVGMSGAERQDSL